MSVNKVAYETISAKNGLLVEVRPIQPDDAPNLIDLFEHMGSESRYLRFHQTLDNPSPRRVRREAEQIVKPEPHKFGLLAFADLPDQLHAPIGGARYVGVGEGVAEVAISVRDDMQRKGIGTQLMKLLIEKARARGIRRLVADVKNNNKGVWRLLEGLEVPMKRTIEGVYSLIEIDLTSL